MGCQEISETLWRFIKNIFQAFTECMIEREGFCNFSMHGNKMNLKYKTGKWQIFPFEVFFKDLWLV